MTCATKDYRDFPCSTARPPAFTARIAVSRLSPIRVMGLMAPGFAMRVDRLFPVARREVR